MSALWKCLNRGSAGSGMLLFFLIIFNNGKTFFPVVDTSAYVFSLIIKRIKTTALKYKVRSTQRHKNEQIKKLTCRCSDQLAKISNPRQNRISKVICSPFPNSRITKHFTTSTHFTPNFDTSNDTTQSGAYSFFLKLL